MKINPLDTVKLQAALDEAQHLSRSRTLTTSDVVSLVDDARAAADRLLPRTHQVGCTYSYCEAGLPNSYRYKTNSTRISLERFPSGWFVTSIDRATIYPGESTTARLTVPEDKREHVLAKLQRDLSFVFGIPTSGIDIPTT